jgi:hypothetical protein
MRLPILAAGLGLLALGACSTPESRVRSSLINIGLPEATATCMAGNVASRLSSEQIQTLSRMSGMSERRIGGMAMGEFTRMLVRSDNAEMAAVLARAGVGCAVMG